MRGQELVEKRKRYEKLKRRCLRLCFTLLAIIVGGSAFMYFSSKGPATGKNLVTRVTPDVFVFTGNNVPVNLIIDPTTLPAEYKPPPGGRSLDIIIGLDNSLSMDVSDEFETPLDLVKKVATSFVNSTDVERHQIGLARLDQEAQIIHGLSHNQTVLKNVINELPVGQGTKVDEGLQAMNVEFNSIRRRPGSLGVAILLTDGQTSARLAREQAKRLTQQEGLFLAPIGIGDYINDDLLKSIASWPSEYDKAKDVEQLNKIYTKWIKNIEDLVAVNVRLSEYHNRDGLKLDATKINQLGTAQDDRIEWSLPFLTTRPETLSYVQQTGMIGWYQLDDSTGTVSFQPVGKKSTTQPIHRKPKVVVISLLLLLLLPLLLLLILLPWLIQWWQRILAARGSALLPDKLGKPAPYPCPEFLQPLQLDKLMRPTQPTLIIGLGGTGRWTLTYLKKAILETNYGRMPETVKFLLFETQEREILGGAAKTVQVGGVELEPVEVVALHEDPNDPKSLFERTQKMADKPDSEPHLKSWWPAQEFKKLSVQDSQISRGTNQRRPYGRMALFLDLEHGSEKSRFWSSVSATVRQLAEHKGKTTVYIPASLAGGTGSGMIIDVAYLVRRICEHEGLGEVTINGLLALQNSFATDILGLTRANTFAALREIDRFLACPDKHFKMTYSPEDDQMLNGRLESPLFDNCYVFDADREYESLIRELPERGVFPTMADTIHTYIYYSPGKEFDEDEQQRRAGKEFSRKESGHGVVTSLGTFVIRLPIFEFLQTFKYRFSRELLVRLFGVTQTKNEEWILKSLSSVEKEQINKRLDDFLKQSGPERSPADVLQCVRDRDPEMLIGIVEADRVHKEQGQYLKQHKINFQRHLGSYLMHLLNKGTDDESKPFPEGERFNFTLNLTRGLVHQFEDVLAQAGNKGRNLSAGRQARIVYELLTAYHEIASDADRRLDAMARAVFSPGSPEKAGSPATTSQSLIQYLSDKQNEHIENRKLDDAIRVRKYLYNEDLEKKLYDDYFGEESLIENLKRLVWQYDEEENTWALKLDLVTYETKSFDPFAAEPTENADKITELAELIAQPMWDMDITPYLDTQYPTPKSVAEKILKGSSPLIQIESSAAPRHIKKLFVSLPESKYLTEVLKQIYPEFASQKNVMRSDFLDPHVFSTVTVLDSLPLNALLPYQQAFSDYLSIDDSQRDQLHLFATEQNAVRLEQRLPGLTKEAKRPFTPRFISSLEDLERARQFALCTIYEFIPNALKLKNDDLKLEIPGESDDSRYLLAQVETATGPDDGTSLNTAFQTFLDGRSVSESREEIPFGLIENRLQEHRKMEANQLKQLLEKCEEDLTALKQDKKRNIDSRDLLSYIHMVLREEMKKLE